MGQGLLPDELEPPDVEPLDAEPLEVELPDVPLLLDPAVPSLLPASAEVPS